MTKIRNFTRVDCRERGIEVDPETFELFRDELSIGKIAEISKEDATLLSPHFGNVSDSFCIAASGISLSGYDYGVFRGTETGFALEWGRKSNESSFQDEVSKDIKINRYLFAICEADGKVRGFDVTERNANAVTGQVGDHHDNYLKLFPKYGFEV